MRDYPRQARVALQVYLERGQRALKCLAAADFDGAHVWLRKRKAAFHNFHAAEAEAAAAGFIASQDREIQEIWAFLQPLERELLNALVEVRDQTKQELTNVSRARKGISKYRSGNVRSDRINEAV